MSETRQQEFAGVIKKCPQCGQPLQSFQAKCPACGYEIQDTKAVNSVKGFFEAYQQEHDEKGQLELIKNFPIPNTKEDLFEFAMLASQQIKAISEFQKSRTNMQNYMFGSLTNNGGIFGQMKNVYAGKTEKISTEDFLIVWQEKLESIRQKAYLALAQDSSSLSQVNKIISGALESISALKKKKSNAKRKYIVFTVACTIFAVIIFFGLYKFIPTYMNKLNSLTESIETPEKKENLRLEMLMNEIQTEIASGNYDSAELKLADLRWKYGSEKYHEADIKIWKEKKVLLQKQIDSKRRGEN